MRKTNLTLATCALVTLCVGTASATLLTAIADNILLQNGTPTTSHTGDAEDNFGGRTEMIIGDSNNQPRHGLFRFDVSGLAADINAGTPIASATLTLTEIMGRDGNNGSISQSLSAFGLVAGNSGWVEGTKTGSAGGWTAETGSSALLYLAAPSALGAGDGTQWLSAGGGADPTGDIPSSVFTFGTDTGLSLGSGTVNFAIGTQETLVITLDAAGLQALLPQWLADGTGNAGLAIESAGNAQLFFESVQTAGGTPATLDIQFIPEPSTFALMGMAGVILFGRFRKR